MTHIKASDLADLFQQKIKQYPDVKRWFVALSGGLDSSVLLHLCHKAQLHNTHQLAVIHINHQLQDAAVDWENHCMQVCSELGVPLRIVKVDVDAGDEGIENGARNARYKVFTDLLEVGDGLLMAHHQDDQAETFILRLMRGSGVKGLAAIPETRSLGRGRLVRALLSVDRESLEHYANAYSLGWIEDPSNQSIAFDRNFLRQQVIPLLKNRWPEFAQKTARSAALCGQANQLNEYLAAIDLRRCLVVGLAGEGVELNELNKLPMVRQVNVIRFWLSERVHFLPNESVIQDWLSQFDSALPDAQPQVDWGDISLRRYQNAIYRVGPVGRAFDDFMVEPEIKYTTSVGCFESQLIRGKGVRWSEGQALIVSFKTKTDKYYLAGRKGGRSLKNIFQEQKVPQWLRCQLPVLLVDGQPAALLGFLNGPLILEGFQVLEKEIGLYPTWVLSISEKVERS